MTVTHSVVATGRTFGGTVRVFVKEAKYEFLKLARTKTFSLSTIGFPVMFYVLFGLSNRGHEIEGMDAAKYMLASYAAFGVIGAALFGIGVSLASERALGWLELKRSSPMPAMAYLAAKCLSAQAFGLIIVSVLMGLAVTFGGVRLTGREVAMLLGMSFAGSIPFTALGLLIALLVPPNAASGVINLIYLPMSFMSGLWIPIPYLPRFLRGIAPYLPACHLSQLMETVFGFARIGTTAGHWEGLAGFTLLTLGACWAVFQRAEQDA